MGSKEYKSGSAAVACADLNPNENEAGLCYIGDGMTGYSRKKWGRGFSYFDDRCRRIRDDAVLARI
jgi:hypothetical protein